MFFTQDDYKKIQQWLTKNSVKDTEFNEASIPFNGEEIITIVQGNQNKKVFLKDLVAQVFNLGVSDFVNITDKYNAPNISLEEAIRLIPSRARKEGQVITFLDKEDHWHIYQFKGVLNQWNVLDTWEDLFDWEKLIIDSILPDEEDLTKSLPDTNGNSYLSFKDRAYNPEDFSGLGRIILRKNIVEVEDPIYGKVKKNVLYQDMINQANTVYVIRYDFTLNEDITIPSNCMLQFDGGSLNADSNNYIITGTNTKINEDASYNIFNDCIIKGFELSKIDIRWVGANQSNSDNALYFQRVFSNIIKYHRGTPVYVVGKYKITSTVTIESDFNLKGFHNNTRFSSLHSTEDAINYACSEIIVNCGNSDIPAFDIIGEFTSKTISFCDLNISNIKFTGTNKTKDVCIRYSASGSPSRPCVIEKCEAHGFLYFIEAKAIDQSVIGNLTIKENNIYENGKALYSYSDGDYMGMCNLSIKDNVIEHNGENCIYLSNVFGSLIINNNILEGEDNPIYIKPYVQLSSQKAGANIEISNNYFEKTSDSDTKIFIDAADPTLNKQFYGADVRIINNSSIFGFKINLKWCRITSLDRIDCPPIFDTKYSVFENCIFEKGVNTEGLYIEQLVGCNFFESYPESNYNDKGGKIGTIGDACTSFADCKGKNNCIISNVCNNIQISSDDSNILLIGRILTTRGDEYNNILIRNQYNSYNVVDKSFYLKYSRPYYFIYKFTKQDASVSAPYNIRSSVSNGTPLGVDSTNFVYYEASTGKIINYPLVVQSPESSHWNGSIWLNSDGYPLDALRKGTTAQRPTSTILGGTLRKSIDYGFIYYDTDLKRHIHVVTIQNNGEVNWAESDGATAGVKRSGTFSQKPADWAIYVGFVYFCTDKQTPEGSAYGIEIIHKGENIWVDALGRLVE